MVYSNHFIAPVLLMGFFLFVVSCSAGDEGAEELLGRIKSNGELVILTTNQPTTYFIDREGDPAGPEFDMTQSFAKYLGVEARYLQLDSVDAVIDALAKGEGDIAAAGLTVTSERSLKYDFGPAYMDVSEYLVCHRSSKIIDDIGQLNTIEIVIPSSTSYIETLVENYPEVTWVLDDDLLTPQLLEKVRSKEIECTISDSTIFDISRRYYPEISSRYTLIEGSELAWMHVKGNPRFNTAINAWFSEYKASGEYAQVVEKYYGHIDAFDYVDIQKFKRRIKKRLPKYKDWFIEAAKKHGISPSLLAAQSYQESHWDPKARSPTGVRGIMMLTLPVAKSLGVKSRLDAKQNIFAGAKFQEKMKEIFDENVSEPDRTWMALAAYNVGQGHFRDAQRLAETLGKNPNLWIDMKDVLPLLSQKKYYKELTYGYARGNEPVQYVTRIRDYDDILAKYFTDK